MWLTLSLLSTALAGQPTSEEITIWGDRIEQAWAELDRTLAELGYEGRVRNGRTVYKGAGSNRWKPRLIVDHDGWSRYRSPVVVLRSVSLSIFSSSFDADMYVPYSAPSTGLSVNLNFWMTSRRKLEARERELASATGAPLAEVRDALSEKVHEVRLATLGETLDRLWATGEQPDGSVIASVDERRAALLTLWATRTATAEGEAVRTFVEDFLRNVVQPSDWPVTPAEAAAAGERCPCQREPEL